MLQVIILARESGLKLELSDIPEKSLVPEPLRVRTNLVNQRRFAKNINSLIMRMSIICCRLVLQLRNLCKNCHNLIRK